MLLLFVFIVFLFPSSSSAPGLAEELNLQDVFTRVSGRAESARLTAIESARALILARSQEEGASPLPKLAHLCRVRDSAEELERQAAVKALEEHDARVQRRASKEFWAADEETKARYAPLSIPGQDKASKRRDALLRQAVLQQEPSREFPFYQLKARREGFRPDSKQIEHQERLRTKKDKAEAAERDNAQQQ